MSQHSGSQSSTEQVEALLARTPYLIADGPDALERFSRVGQKAWTIGDRAVAVADSIARQAEGVLPQFELAVTADLVAESNRMEGIDSSPVELRNLARVKSELFQMEVNGFIEFIRDDDRMLESLGLLRAYRIADEWARAASRPREYEIRQLHALVMPSLGSGGQYKIAPNTIGMSSHVPTDPGSVGDEMAALAQWFEAGTGDPALDAAVVHAWLTHIHPFDDGNGRMARLLANLALVQAQYPPLLLRSRSDRARYLDALEASDDGDILPLYDLFVGALRRVVLTMEKPNYVDSKIRGELLASVEQRYRAWLGQARALFDCIDQKLRTSQWSPQLMGYPAIEDFALLENRSPDGNCWFLKLRHRGVAQWLVWFGYRSDAMSDLIGGQRSWPSIFLAQRTEDPRAVHPFETRFEGDDGSGRPAELTITPGRQRPVTVRSGYDTQDLRLDEAAGMLVKALARD